MNAFRLGFFAAAGAAAFALVAGLVARVMAPTDGGAS